MDPSLVGSAHEFSYWGIYICVHVYVICEQVYLSIHLFICVYIYVYSMFQYGTFTVACAHMCTYGCMYLSVYMHVVYDQAWTGIWQCISMHFDMCKCMLIHICVHHSLTLVYLSIMVWLGMWDIASLPLMTSVWPHFFACKSRKSTLVSLGQPAVLHLMLM